MQQFSSSIISIEVKRFSKNDFICHLVNNQHLVITLLDLNFLQEYALLTNYNQPLLVKMLK